MMQHEVVCGDVIDGLRSLPDASVQCVVTSPPYYGLRAYLPDEHPDKGREVGLEPTPDEYVAKMVEVFREVWRVLRDDGVVWLNLGDTYASGNRTTHGTREGYLQQTNRGSCGGCDAPRPQTPPGLKPKDLIGIPWRVAFALQADGWTLRSDIIWSKLACVPSTAEDKPNAMPEGVTDRPTKSHEYIFLLAKSQRYFYDAEAIKEEASESEVQRGIREYARGLNTQQNRRTPPGQTPQSETGALKNTLRRQELAMSGTRNKRTVWEIATQPTPEAHFATFPKALVEPCIKAGTSERGCCPGCGAPWVRVVESRRIRRDEFPPTDPRYRPSRYTGAYESINGRGDAGYRVSTTTGWEPTCTCDNGDPVPCVVLDPFGGAGTVALVARDLGRSSILIELNPEYVEIIRKRLRIGEQLDTGICKYVLREVRP